jgi:hypothetical protein
MPFRETQLGRFGSFGVKLLRLGSSDPDQLSAHLYASNGQTQYAPMASRPTVDQILASKGIWDHASPTWRSWSNTFDGLKRSYLPTIAQLPLQALCTAPQPRALQQCWHELVPPVEHVNLREFTQQILPTLSKNSVAQDAQGHWYIPKHARPLWNFIITEAGDILLYEELDHFSVVKHSSLSGGDPVWSAGKVGIESQQIRLVDLDSGHFITHPGHHFTAGLLQQLVDFTAAVFRHYAAGLLSGVQCLHAQFACTV